MTAARGFTAFAIPAAPGGVRPAVARLLDTAQAWGVPAASRAMFEVAIGEVVINAVKHGGGGGGQIRCELELGDDALIVRVFDDGAGFDPARLVARPSPDRDRPDELEESGYGLSIVHAVFPRVRPLRRDGLFGVELTLPHHAPPPVS